MSEPIFSCVYTFNPRMNPTHGAKGHLYVFYVASTYQARLPRRSLASRFGWTRRMRPEIVFIRHRRKHWGCSAIESPKYANGIEWHLPSNFSCNDRSGRQRNSRCWISCGSMLGLRRRYWPNFEPKICKFCVGDGKRYALILCCFDVGPPSKTEAQHQTA